ncbi:lipase 1-like isoform X2 [Leptopilina heterotoma]|uniref:lipase 1-like isoform X2 n=1 Tax=Leptopilina heterotoma TaxID=63436 RepID=UPI001CA7CFE2|nr:lipase 1-like isoform X2 [Leptopilina heterotoma]
MKVNYLLFILIGFQWIFFSISVPMDDAKTVKDIVSDDGYQLETHYVETEDGYILEMHRILKVTENIYKKYPVYIKHGLGECSVLFLLSGPNRAIAYLLVDKGYDVWLGNNRGNMFSKNHSTFLSTSFGFWNFSWHEIGLYDDSAMMDYILQRTESNKLFYICHSQGCTELFVLLSLRPEYNKKIQLAVNLAPAVFTKHLSGITGLASPFSHIGSYIFETFGHVDALDGSTWLRIVTNFFCAKTMITQPICRLVLNSVEGFSSFKKDNILNKFLIYFPSGGSTKQLFHYGFGAHSPAEFRQYDYGRKINEKIYNSRLPPKYSLEKATLPVAILYGSRDFLAAPKDVGLLIKVLPNVIYSKLIKGYSHFDFLIGINVRSKVYEKTLELLERYEKNERS